MRRIAFATLGCKVNQYDTEGVRSLFEAEGYRVVPFDSVADVYIVNTCTVTSTGESKSRQLLRRARRRNPIALVVAMGCYSEVAPERVEELAVADLIFGTRGRDGIPRAVEERIMERGSSSSEESIIQPAAEYTEFEDLTVDGWRGRTRAFVKVQDGCNRCCSYCIVPRARGPSRSRPMESVIGEVERLASKGYREIVLTGVELGAYGLEVGYGDSSLADLIRAVASVPEVLRVRLGSLDIRDIDEDLITVLADTPVVCRHLHLPVQSGDDGILTLMRRDYTSKAFREGIDRLRSSLQGLAVSTDVIVGFPGEDRSSFQRTVSFVQKCGFSRIHVFGFSKREGTAAASMDDQVKSGEIKARTSELISVAEDLALSHNRRHLGNEVGVLVEGLSRERWYHGLTEDYVRAEFIGDHLEPGTLVTVSVRSADYEGVYDRTEEERAASG